MTTFSFTEAVVAITPELKIVSEANMELIKIFKEDILLTLIATPPDISELLIGTGILLTGETGLTSTSRTINPDTTALISLTITDHMIFLDALDLIVAADIYIGRDLI